MMLLPNTIKNATAVRGSASELDGLDDRMLEDVGVVRIDTWPCPTYRRVDRETGRRRVEAGATPFPSVRDIMRVLLSPMRNAR